GYIASGKNDARIGWTGGIIPDHETERLSGGLRDKKMFPVFLEEEEIERYYEGFSNGTLWPAFHYFGQYISYNDAYWKAYEAVNEKFCAAILEIAGPEDTIWIHDYHLLLLPKLIKEKLPTANVAFFQHIPFPSYE